jgi:protein ImuA
MQFISAIDGVLRTRPIQTLGREKNRLGGELSALDKLLPDGGLARGAVHEILGERDVQPWFFALLLARAALAASDHRGAVVWSDPAAELFPPALAAALPMDRLFLLQIDDESHRLWAVSQCLRCRGVAAVIASPRKLSPIEARRLQLAAERGGGVGLLLRSADSSPYYAAATRWLVRPAPGTAAVQRWSVQLVHHHGGILARDESEPVLIEVRRDICDPNHVRAIEPLEHRPDSAEAAKASA